MSNQKETLAIYPLEGYAAPVSFALGSLKWERKKTIELVSDLSDDQLELTKEGVPNSIGTLLYHVAIIELDWLYAEILDQDIATIIPPVMETEMATTTVNMENVDWASVPGNAIIDPAEQVQTADVEGLTGFENPEDAFTHTLNELRYYINCGIVVLICSAAILIAPKHRLAIFAFLLTMPLNILLKSIYPEMNYFVRAGWVIVSCLTILLAGSYQGGFTRFKDYFKFDDHSIKWVGGLLLVSLIALHIIFH